MNPTILGLYAQGFLIRFLHYKNPALRLCGFTVQARFRMLRFAARPSRKGLGSSRAIPAKHSDLSKCAKILCAHETLIPKP